MESDFKFLVTLLGQDFTTDRQTSTEWSGVRFWRETSSKAKTQMKPDHIFIHSAGVLVNSYQTG